LVANAFFLAWCVPAAILFLTGLKVAATLVAALTVGPGLVGLATYAGRLARGRPGRSWRDSLTGARAGFGAGAALGILAAAAMAGLAAALRGASTGSLGPGALILVAAQVPVMLVALMAGVHTLSLVGLYDQSLGSAVRNAVLLSLHHPGPTASLMSLGLIALVFVGVVGWGTLIILPAVLTVCAVNRTLLLVKEHVTAT